MSLFKKLFIIFALSIIATFGLGCSSNNNLKQVKTLDLVKVSPHVYAMKTTPDGLAVVKAQTNTIKKASSPKGKEQNKEPYVVIVNTNKVQEMIKTATNKETTLLLIDPKDYSFTVTNGTYLKEKVLEPVKKETNYFKLLVYYAISGAIILFIYRKWFKKSKATKSPKVDLSQEKSQEAPKI
jgi:hypothetical protein